jgi:hypothetical protein
MQETREGKDHQMNHSRASQLGLTDPWQKNWHGQIR